MKYQSFHFSPLNNRSMLMPRIPKGETFVPKTPVAPGSRVKYPPIPQEQINKENPYFQTNLGFWAKETEVDGVVRKYGLYVPGGMMSKGAALVVFPESGVKAEEFVNSYNWKQLSEKYHTALIVLESDGWKKEEVEKDFDYARKVIDLEFQQRLTVDVCESYIYPIGFGEGAYTATAFALTYSATFPAFAADGDCAVDPELLDVLRGLPSDGVDTLRKTDIALPAFVIDRSGRAEATAGYLKEIIRAKEEGLYNKYGKVYMERERPGEYFVNEQVIGQTWIADAGSVGAADREELNEAMLNFVLRFARWGGFANNHMRTKKGPEITGVERVHKEIDGLKRFWDVYVPSCYRPDDGKEYPLVVAIHGMSCNSEYFAETSDWYRLAEERGFFVCFACAYPRNDGNARFPVPHWALTPGQENPVDEVIYFRHMLDYMEAEYNIDKKRIYAVGHSNGSQMTQMLARTIPERFAAFGPTGALAGWDPENVVPLTGDVQRPVWFIMGQYDIMDSNVTDGSIAKATLEAYCAANKMTPTYDNWYVNGRYHTLVMYNDAHIPMVQYTIMKDCPHTYTAEMAQLTWDCFLCHFSREEDGTVVYKG